jgi:hypothetical protein
MKNFETLISTLLHSKTQAHVFHLQTKSYAEHMALAGYYGGIDDLVDGLVESYQGKYGIIKNYESFKVSSYKDNSQLQAYFKTLDKEVTKLRADTDKDTYLANQVDTVVELIQSTLYKLAFLK